MLSYGEFSAGLQRRSFKHRIPLSGTIEVTRRCPMACCHCYNNLAMEDREARLGELSYDDHCRVLDEITDSGCLWLLYTGGEIFARRDFLDIYTYAKKKGLLITLFTNGTLVTPDVADHLAQWIPFSIGITLYGRTRETYERITGIPGSFEKCMRGIRLLRDRRLPLYLKTTAITLNKHEIWDMKQFAEQELGLEFTFDCMINPRIDNTQSPLAVRLTPAEVIELDLLDPKRVAAWASFTRQFNGPVHSSGDGSEMYHCGGGINSFAIDPQGRMSICVLSHTDTYDLRTGSFRTAWQEFLGKVRGRKITRATKCLSCEIKAMCGMCPANGELERGDPESPVDFLCQVAHLRSHVLGIPVPGHGGCEHCMSRQGYDKLIDRVRGIGDGGTKIEPGSGPPFDGSPGALKADDSACGCGFAAGAPSC